MSGILAHYRSLGQDVTIIYTELPRANVIKLALEKTFLDRGQTIGENNAIKMVILVLDDTSGNALESLGMLHPILVTISDSHPILAHNILVNARYTQTPLVERNRLAGTLENMGINKHLLEIGTLRIEIGKRGRVDDKDTDIAAYLRGSQSHAVGLVHGLPKVIYKFGKAFVIGSNILGNFTKERVTININR